MFFQTEISGIPCTCHVLHYAPAEPMIIMRGGFGDAYPPEPEEFDYELLDQEGNIIPSDQLELSSSDTERLLQLYKAQLEELNEEHLIDDYTLSSTYMLRQHRRSRNAL